jgi:hypothetical protein
MLCDILTGLGELCSIILRFIIINTSILLSTEILTDVPQDYHICDIGHDEIVNSTFPVLHSFSRLKNLIALLRFVAFCFEHGIRTFIILSNSK